MKLKNKKTGKIGYLYEHSLLQDIIIVYDVKGIVGKYKSITELNEEWEDAPEEPKEWWYIDTYICERNCQTEGANVDRDNFNKEIGNYFTTKGEAELAVERLKAWKRLKDKGFKFEGWYGGSRIIHFRIDSLDKEGDCLPHFIDDDTANDLDLLFGGEE